MPRKDSHYKFPSFLGPQNETCHNANQKKINKWNGLGVKNFVHRSGVDHRKVENVRQKQATE